MNKLFKQFGVLLVVLVLSFVLVGCKNTVSEKQWKKVFDVESYNNVEMIVETYEGTRLRYTSYRIQDDLIRVVTVIYENDEIIDTIRYFYKEDGEGTSDAYFYLKTTETWSKLDEKSEVTKEYLLKYLTDFADQDMSKYTFNEEYDEYVMMSENGLVEMSFLKGRLAFAKYNYKEYVTGTKIIFQNYNKKWNYELPNVED